MKHVAAFFSGLVFSVGLVIAGMTQPGKVVGFLDFLGDWDPSLAFVMAGAIAVHLVLLRLVLKRPKPVFAPVFQVPGLTHIDRRLVIGAALFGIGWGLAGYCPGPAIVSVGAGGQQAVWFVLAMGAGMLGFRWLEASANRHGQPKQHTAEAHTDASLAVAPTRAEPVEGS